MLLSQKTIILTIFIAITAIFLYSVRSVLTPFVLGAVFAYVLNPAVIFLEKRIKLPKTLAVVTVFLIVVVLIGAVSTEIGIRLAQETKEFSLESKYVNSLTNFKLFFVKITWFIPFKILTVRLKFYRPIFHISFLCIDDLNYWQYNPSYNGFPLIFCHSKLFFFSTLHYLTNVRRIQQNPEVCQL